VPATTDQPLSRSKEPISVSIQFLKRTLVVLTIGVVQLGLLVVPATLSSGSTPKALPTKTIITGTNTFVNQIRQYFFCQTSKCKKEVAANKAKVLSAVAGIDAYLKLMMNDSVPSSESRLVHKYGVDARALISAVALYPKQKNPDDEAQNAGIIYYQSANVGSDSYLLDAVISKVPVSFSQWSVGVVGVVYAMQVDTQAESSKASTATDISANRSLLLEATSLRSDANGPNAAFNALLVKFASTQTKESSASILTLEGKKSSTSQTELAALATSLSAQFSKIVSTQNKLAK
jgi:hypothetical protein